MGYGIIFSLDLAFVLCGLAFGITSPSSSLFSIQSCRDDENLFDRCSIANFRLDDRDSAVTEAVTEKSSVSCDEYLRPTLIDDLDFVEELSNEYSTFDDDDFVTSRDIFFVYLINSNYISIYIYFKNWKKLRISLLDFAVLRLFVRLDLKLSLK